MIKKIFLLSLYMSMSMGLSAQKNTSSKDFAVRGFHLDLRIQVMKMPALKEFASFLGKNGVNTLVMEWEGTYPFEKHPIIPNRFAYTREEIRSFIAYCKSLNIDVIPLQQSFGHVEYILRNYRYKKQREDQKEYSQVDPLEEQLNRQLFEELYKDLISTHDSPYIHIGGDETYLLGHSERSKKKAAAVGKGRLYGDYIKILCDLVVSLGKRPVLWADIALHYPDALKGLPKQTIFVDWNYGWETNMFGDHEKLMQSGFEIWGSPAIRSHPDNYFLTQWEKHFNNIRDFIPTARNFGYKGMVMTSWSTSGLYSTEWETTKDLVDLYPVRRVYPISGFNMLISAYFEGLRTTESLNPKKFVLNYAQSTYGLNQRDAEIFLKALFRSPFEINQGVISQSSLTIDQLLDSAKRSSSEFKVLRPTRNREEFEHYRLMTDIRVQYLSYTSVEIELNSPNFNQVRIPALLDQLKVLETEKIDKRFVKLNKSLLYEGELIQENRLRNSKIKLLIQRLSRDR